MSVVVVTGASAGIGRAIARRFAADGDRVALVARRKDLEDNPIPSGNSSAAYGLLRLAALTGEYEYVRRAVSVFRLLHNLMPQHPQAFPHLLQALDFHAATVKEVALAGPDTAGVTVVEDVEGVYGSWLDELAADVVLVRPDFHVYGTAGADYAAELATGFLARLAGLKPVAIG